MNTPRHLTRAVLAALFVSVLMSCQMFNPSPGDWPAAVGPRWNLTKIQGDSVPPTDPPYLEFAEDGRMAGSAGVNRMFGTYQSEADGSLSFAAVGVTRMLSSDPDRQQLETRFLEHLNTIDAYRIKPDRLTLLSEGKALLIFTPAADAVTPK